jgi:hypothetical protein
VSLYWNGHATETTAVVCVQSDESGTVDVNGVSAVADTSVDDGNVAITLTGLSAGQSYPYTARINGAVIGSGEVRTAPAAGQSFSVIAFSCMDQGYNWPWAEAHTQHNVRAVVALGDWPYLDTPVNGNSLSYWGQPAGQGMSWFLRDNPSATDAQKRANYWLHCKQARATYGMQKILHSCAVYHAMDDHEYIGNNTPFEDGSVGVTGANFYVAGLFANDAAAATFANQCEDWLHAYWKGHPANTDAGADPTKPWLYYRFRLGDAEFWSTNSYHYDDGVTQLGATQKQWLIDTILASDARYKFWMLTPGGTGFPSVVSELDDILTDINGAGLTCVLVGDQHMPHVRRRGGVTFINTSPVGQGVNTGVPSPGSGDVVWHPFRNSSVEGFFFNHARIDISPEQARVALVDPAGNERITFEFLPSGGGLRESRVRVG